MPALNQELERGVTRLNKEMLELAGEVLIPLGNPPTPETLRLVTVVEGKALRAIWPGHEFYRTAFQLIFVHPRLLCSAHPLVWAGT